MSARRAVTALLAAAALAALAGGARAATKLEGEYTLVMDARKTQRDFPWDWNANNNDSYAGLQMRLFSQPRTNVDAFLKMEADWRSPENSGQARPLFQYRESHVEFRWPRGPRQLTLLAFSRQERFWVDNYLVRAVETNDLKNDAFGSNAQGVRFDTQGWLGMNTAFIASDFSHQNNTLPAGAAPRGTDDAFIARARREFLHGTLRLGTTVTRKQENELSEVSRGLNTSADVVALDSRVRVGNTDVSLEYLQSRSSLDAVGVIYPSGLGRRLANLSGTRFPDRGVLVGEVRSLRFGTPRLGFLSVTPTVWQRGALYENRLGDSQGQQSWYLSKNDETGYKVDSYYLLPERAITYTNSWKKFGRRAYEHRDDWELYNELYVEFVNGFTGKTYLRHYHIRRDESGQVTNEEYRDWFNEVQVESRLAWLRVQSKFKDFGLPIQKQLFTVETRVNMTGKMTFYNRFALGNDPSIQRKAVWSQLQYRPTGSVEMYVEYGPSWVADDSTPVNDNDLLTTGDHVDMVKFVLKGVF